MESLVCARDTTDQGHTGTIQPVAIVPPGTSANRSHPYGKGWDHRPLGRQTRRCPFDISYGPWIRLQRFSKTGCQEYLYRTGTADSQMHNEAIPGLVR